MSPNLSTGLAVLLTGASSLLAQTNASVTKIASTNLVQPKAGATTGQVHAAEVKADAGPVAPPPLFNGTDLNQFYSWISGEGTFSDPSRVFSVQDGLLRISGEEHGYLATKQQYSNYRLLVEYKWGEAKWDIKKPRNSGVFVHATGVDGLWMRSVECQVAEGITGDLVLHGGAKATVDGEKKGKDWTTITRKGGGNLENAFGNWNTMEILCESNRIQVTVNGKVSADVTEVSPHRGKIFLQSNGGEIFFRKLELQSLDKPPVQNLADAQNPTNKVAQTNSDSPKPAAPAPAAAPATNVIVTRPL